MAYVVDAVVGTVVVGGAVDTVVFGGVVGVVGVGVVGVVGVVVGKKVVDIGNCVVLQTVEHYRTKDVYHQWASLDGVSFAESTSCTVVIVERVQPYEVGQPHYVEHVVEAVKDDNTLVVEAYHTEQHQIEWVHLDRTCSWERVLESIACRRHSCHCCFYFYWWWWWWF